MPSITLTLIRHGRTPTNESGVITGQTDVPLSAEGRAQVEEARSQLPDGIVAIYSSTALRCQQTTEILNQDLQLPVIFTGDLWERNFGDLAGLTWEEATEKTQNPDLATLDRFQGYDYTPHGGESALQVSERFSRVITEIRDHHKEPGSRILVVTHGGIVRMALHFYTDQQGLAKIPNASLHHFEFPIP
ncbi:MAG: histidine phosphatase family protein [Patescibacteria group bacterium]